MTCDEVLGMAMDDDAVRIFLNTHGENDDDVMRELVEFLHYVENSNDNTNEIMSPRVRQIAKKVDDIKSI